MSKTTKPDDDLARIIKEAGPRPMPSDDDTAAARSAVHAEWRAVLGRKRRQRTWIGGAIAASLVVAVGLLLQPAPDAIQVATIDKLQGSIYVASKAGELERASDLAVLHVGNSLRTGRDSVAGLMLESGGSLRIAEDSSLSFLEDGIVELRAGKVYVDSKPDLLTGATHADQSSLRIRTEFGDVTHVGTQYMVEIANQELIVSVREGEVALDRGLRAAAGERLRTDGLDVDRSAVAAWGDPWRWIESASPGIDVDQQTADVFLRWVAHETGFTLEFADEETANNAAATVLSGSIDAAPRDALGAWVLAADYAYEFDERRGVIRIGRR